MYGPILNPLPPEARSLVQRVSQVLIAGYIISLAIFSALWWVAANTGSPSSKARRLEKDAWREEEDVEESARGFPFQMLAVAILANFVNM